MMTVQAKLGFDDSDRPLKELLLECIHCGLCMPACPTYSTLGVEADSPRGRLYLMAKVHGGQLALTKRFVDHMHLCLLCRACESACPSGVKYGRLMEAVRGQIRRRYKQSALERFTRHMVFKTLLPEQSRLEAIFRLSRLYQRTGLQGLMRRSGFIRLLPKRLKALDEYIPPIPLRFFRTKEHLLTEPEGKKEHRVGFFSGCIMSLIFPSANEATLNVLAKNGCEVVTPSAQRCCGALHLHNGELEIARQLARANIDAFDEADVGFIVSNAGGCGATLKEYVELLRGDPQYANRAEEFTKKVVDFSEFLTGIGLNKAFGLVEAKTTYQDPCHLAHVQRIKDQPRSLIRSVPGVELVEMRESDRCCGSAGSYWFTNRDLSMKLLDSKMSNAVATKADIIVTANPPCLLHLRLGVERTRMGAKVIHLAELLDWAYRAAKTETSN
jgi:glycolate oxidase iron-sulfur subunit